MIAVSILSKETFVRSCSSNRSFADSAAAAILSLVGVSNAFAFGPPLEGPCAAADLPPPPIGVDASLRLTGLNGEECGIYPFLQAEIARYPRITVDIAGSLLWRETGFHFVDLPAPELQLVKRNREAHGLGSNCLPVQVCAGTQGKGVGYAGKWNFADVAECPRYFV